MPALTDRLNQGLDSCDPDVIDAIGLNLPTARYLPLLLEVRPRLIEPGGPGDYFTDEQVATWGIDPATGSPEDPKAPYYQLSTTSISAADFLFEFVVPLVPPSWNDSDRVAAYVKELAETAEPTCAAVGILDVRQQADWDTPTGGHSHWGLTHFLLDGHHKIEAAARTDRAVRMISLITIDHSLASPQDLQRLPEILLTSPDRKRPGF